MAIINICRVITFLIRIHGLSKKITSSLKNFRCKNIMIYVGLLIIHTILIPFQSVQCLYVQMYIAGNYVWKLSKLVSVLQVLIQYMVYTTVVGPICSATVPLVQLHFNSYDPFYEDLYLCKYLLLIIALSLTLQLQYTLILFFIMFYLIIFTWFF